MHRLLGRLNTKHMGRRRAGLVASHFIRREGGSSSATGDRDVSKWIVGITVIGGFTLFAWLERRYPLRTRLHEQKATRDARNIALAGLAGAVQQFVERPVTNRLTEWVRSRRLGILPQLGLPSTIDIAAGCV